MRFSVGGGILTGNAAESHNVGNRVPADAVSAVHAARHFAGSEETGDALSFLRLNFSLRVDRHAAHRVMDAGRHFRCIERGLVERDHHLGTSESRVLPRLVCVPVVLEGRLKVRDRNVDLFRKIGNGISLHGIAVLEVAARKLVCIEDGLIVDQINLLAGLLQFVLRNDVARQQLVREALAFLIDENRPAGAHRLGDEMTVG